MSVTSVVFLFGFVAALGLCVFRNPAWGLYTYLAVFYLDPPSRWWGQSFPDIRWSLVAAAVTLVSVFARKRNAAREPFLGQGLTWIFILYVAWMWIQTPFALSSEHVTGAVLFTKYLILLYIIYQIADTPEQVRNFLLAHVMGCFYLGWLAFRTTAGGRLEGVGGPGIDDANAMSMHLGTGLVIGAMLLMTERRWRFWPVLLAMPFVLNGIVLGNSRGAVLGLLAGGVALFWLKPVKYRKEFILFGVLGGVLLLYLAHDAFWERLSSLTASEQNLDFSARSRTTIIAAQWQMFLDHPFGVGHAGTEALSRQYLPEEFLAVREGMTEETAVRSSHNTFMSVLVDQGTPGVLLLFMLLAWAWRAIRLTTRRDQPDPRTWGYATAIGAALMVAVVAGQFSPYLKAEVQYWCLGLLMSLAAAARVRLAPTGAPARVGLQAGSGVAAGKIEPAASTHRAYKY
jgi:O-antigen ligase